MRQRVLQLIHGFLLACAISCAIVPTVLYFGLNLNSKYFSEVILFINFIAWIFVGGFISWKRLFDQHISKVAKESGVDPHSGDVVSQLLKEAKRTRSLLSLNLIEQKINSKKELTRALEHIATLIYNLLKAESAELALFDSDTRTYHSSFVVGKPFRSSAQAMLSGALEGNDSDPEPGVMVQPIAFAGTILGSLRVSLQENKIPTALDRQILQLLAIQSGVAILNTKYTEELLKMKSASEESIKAKTGFLANLSHELRAPLGIMLNATELVLDGICGAVTDEQAETLDLIKTNGDHLLELINDVLDYAKIESGKLNPQKTTVLVSDMLKDIFNVIRTSAEEKDHALTLTPLKEALAVSVDRRHLRQILINILSNAVKYTPSGGQINIWSERIPGNKVRINVQDSGIGIAPSQRRKVFGAFERIEDSYAMSQEGTGLGMSLTKRLVEVNDGKIDFQSEKNKGSHFWITFDATQAERSMDEPFIQEHKKVDGLGNGILLLQKEDGERELLAKYLKNSNFEIYLSETLGKAEQIIKTYPIHMVIIDNNIIDEKSSDSIDIVRDAAKEVSLPVLLLSSRAFVFDIEKYLRAGIDRCLIKPLHLKDLGRTCRELIDGNYSGEIINKEEYEMFSDNENSLQDSKNSETLTSKKMLGVDDILH